MSLLQALKLPPREKPIQPMPIMGITETQGAEVRTKTGARPIAVPAPATADLRGKLEARDKVLRDAYAKLAAAQPKLDERIAATRGDSKAAAVAQKADVDKHLAGIERQLTTLDADRKALDDPRTDAKKMNDILVRAKSQQPVGKAVEVDRHDGDYERKPTETRTTTTTTSVADGKSTTRVSDKSTSVGLDGASRKSVESKETVTATGKTSTTLAKDTTLGPSGFSTETTKKREAENGDRKTGIEEKKGLKVGADGVSSTSSRTTTATDGSGTSVKSSTGAERGDGKAGVVTSKSTATTDADGNTSTRSATGKGGITGGKDGVGAYGEGEGSLQKKGKGGLAVGAVGGLNAKISCNIKAMPGEVPPKYVLETSINLGASLKASGGHDKEGAAGKAGATVSGSGVIYMRARQELGEAEAAAYVAALRAGGSAGASRAELAVIHEGLSKNWDAAQRMYLALSGKMGTASDLDSMKAGESKTIGAKATGGAGINAEAKGFGIELGAEKSREREMTVTKGADGSAAYDTRQGEGDKRTAGGKVSVGMAEMGGSIGKTVTTSTGYKFLVKPGMKNARELQDQIARLANASQAEVDAFARAHPETVVERVDVRDRNDQTKITAGALGVKGSFLDGAGVEDTVTRDADGKIVDTRKRGHNEGGLALSAGGRSIGTEINEEAGARVGADGERVVDVTKSVKDTDTVKFLDSLPLVGSKKKGDKGAVATATGAAEEEDTSQRNIKGITLSASDLKVLASRAKNEAEWGRACPSPRVRDAWFKAASEIRSNGGTEKAVEDALAKFIGGDSMRAEVVNQAIRGKAGDVSSGSRWEFPDSVGPARKDYEDLVIAASETLVAKAGKEDKAKGESLANDFLTRLGSLDRRIRSATDFKQPAVRSEMMSAIASRRSKIQIEVRKLGGADQATAEKAQERAEYEALLDACITHKQTEDDCFAKIDAEHKKTLSNADPVIVVALTVQIKDLHSTWMKDYNKMATLAQENNWGKDHYWKFKPDAARLNRAVKSGKAEQASAPQAETKDMRRNPDAVSAKAHGDMNKKSADTLYVNFQKAKKELAAARRSAQDHGKALKEPLKKNPLSAALKLAAEAERLFNSADGRMKQIRQDQEYMDDMWDHGVPATEEFKQAGALLAKARAMMPK